LIALALPRRIGLRTRLAKPDLALAVLAFVVPVVVYLPAVIHSYGLSDDYFLLADAQGLPAPDPAVGIPEGGIAGGRPVGTAIYDLTFGAAGSIDGLWLIRLWGVIGIGGLSALVFWLTRKAGLARPIALTAAVGCALLPAFVESAAWATAAAFPWVCLVSGLAGTLVTTSRSARRDIAAVALLVVGLLTYQPAAMFLWCVVAIRIVGSPLSLADQWQTMRRALLVMAIAIAIFALVVEVGVHLSHQGLSDRTHPLSPADLPYKGYWFLTRYVGTGARPFLVSDTSPLRTAMIGLPVLAVTAAGLWLRARGSQRQRLLHLGLVALTIPLTVLPNLVAAENRLDFRIVISLGPLMFILFVLAAATLIDQVHGPRWPAALRATLFAVTLMAGVVSARNVLSDSVIHPATTKEAFMRGALTTSDGRPSAIFVYVPRNGWASPQRLGLWSARSDLESGWVAVPEVRLILAEEHRPYASDVQVHEIHTAGRRLPPGARLIDTRPLQQMLAHP
jgi:hypothetical protein